MEFFLNLSTELLESLSTESMLENPAENFCILQELNMTIQEYLMYNFKLSMINSSKHEM